MIIGLRHKPWKQILTLPITSIKRPLLLNAPPPPPPKAGVYSKHSVNSRKKTMFIPCLLPRLTL